METERTERNASEDLMAALIEELTGRYGPLIGGEALQRALGYRSAEAFRQAQARAIVPIPVFAIPRRRGKYALVRDLARWLAAVRTSADQ